MNTSTARQLPPGYRYHQRDEYGQRQQRTEARREINPAAQNAVRHRVSRYTDYSMVFIVFFMAVFGLIILYSVSAYESNLKFGDSTYYFRHQAVVMATGIAVMLVTAFLPSYRLLQYLAIPAYLASVAMICLIVPFGSDAFGAKRSLRLLGVSIQPAEIAKIAIILFVACMVSKMGRKAFTGRGFAILFIAPLPLSGLVFVITRNLSSAIIIFGIAMVMLFVAVPDYKRFIGLAALGGCAVYGMVFWILNYADPEDSFRFVRVLAWRDPEAYEKGYQTIQALYAIGSGGFFGKGLGESMQKVFVPEAQNDMIFSIICEELGLFGGIAVILMFVLLLWRMMIIAVNAPDVFGTMLTVGVMAHIAIQVILNIAVVTNTIPNTGVTLPFISYGGSAVLFQMLELGIVMNVARRIQVIE